MAIERRSGRPTTLLSGSHTLIERLRRRLRLSATMARINLRGQADFRVDFALSILDGLLWQTSTIVFASVLLVRFAGIGDWSSSDILMLAAMRMTAHALTTLFTGRLVFISFMIVEGQIDTFLTRPLSVFRQIQYSKFNVNAFGDILVGGTMLVIAIRLFEHPWTLGRAGLLVGGVIGGALVEAGVTTALAGLILLWPWLTSWQFRFVEILTTVGNYPLSILPPLAQTLLTFVLPIAFVAFLPAAALTDRVPSTGLPAWLVYGSPLVGLVVYAVGRGVWHSCLNRYQGANG